MTPRCAEQIDRNYKLADQYSRYDLIPISLFLSKFYKNHANLSNLMAIYEYSDSESYLSKYTFICSFICILLRDPAVQKVVHTACANQTNSVLNIKNALTNWVILQQICTKNKLK